MLLYTGSINDVINISNSAWESEKMYAAPRESIEDLVRIDKLVKNFSLD